MPHKLGTDVYSKQYFPAFERGNFVDQSKR